MHTSGCISVASMPLREEKRSGLLSRNSATFCLSKKKYHCVGIKISYNPFMDDGSLRLGKSNPVCFPRIYFASQCF